MIYLKFEPMKLNNLFNMFITFKPKRNRKTCFYTHINDILRAVYALKIKTDLHMLTQKICLPKDMLGAILILVNIVLGLDMGLDGRANHRTWREIYRRFYKTIFFGSRNIKINPQQISKFIRAITKRKSHTMVDQPGLLYYQ